MSLIGRTIVCALLMASCLHGQEREGAGPPPSTDVIQKVDDFLRTRQSPFQFSGSVLVAVGDKIILDKGYGYADAELAVPNTPERIFRIGSLTKPLAAVSVMALVEQHRVSLDDSVCRYLSYCPESWLPVKIKHLLSHTSGIPELFNAVPAAPLEATRDAIDKTIRSASNTALDAEPGSKYAYRNFNYMLLGYVDEVAAGNAWSKVLAETVFSPAGMTQTAYDDVWAIVPNRVRGYDVKEGKLRNIAYKDHSAYAAGGLRSTTHDLLAFANAFFGGRLVALSTVKEMTTSKLGDYGYGWQVKHYFGEPMINHSGGIDGFASHLAFYPRQHLSIIVLSNIESEPAKLTACNIAAILLLPDHQPVNQCQEP